VVTGNELDLIEAIRNGSAIAVSNGSYSNSYATAGLIITGHDLQTRLTSRVIAPGGPKDMSAYRGELTGILATIQLVSCLCVQHDILDGGITFGCDREAALSRAFSSSCLGKVEESSYDLIAAIQKLLSISTISWQHHHIKGHQDREQGIDTLDQWALLNIEADGLAKSFLTRAHEQTCHYLIPQEPWSLWHQNKKIAPKLDVAYNLIHSRTAINYWIHTRKTEDNALELVHWEGIHRALQTIPREKQVRVYKHTVGFVVLRNGCNGGKGGVLPPAPTVGTLKMLNM